MIIDYYGTLKERVYKHFRVDASGCWVWTGATSGGGYARIGTGSRKNGTMGSAQASHASWQVHNGPVPPGMFLCHHCDNRRCVNPAHMFVGTHQQNMDDMRAKGRQRNARTKAPTAGEGQP